jgi:hydrogenase/urease accessory protein HupE
VRASSRGLWHYLVAGVQHIVTGGEHIAFIVALIL